MKLFYLINEPWEGYQVGYRAAIRRLIEQGGLEDVFFFSHRVEEQQQGWEAAKKRLKERILAFEPDAVLAAHLDRRHVFEASFFEDLRGKVGKRFVVGYDERDVYGKIRKPITSAIRKILSMADIAFIVADGGYRKWIAKMCPGETVFLPNVTETIQFGKEWIPTMDRPCDVVMIGNQVRSRIPILSMPGVKEREALAKKLYSVFKDRFRLYGAGWDGYGGWHGVVPFGEQEAFLRESWISAGHDHFIEYDKYYSDRLPIALLSGVPYVTRTSPSLGTLFQNGFHCFLEESVDDCVSRCIALMKEPKEYINQIGSNGRKFVLENFTEDLRMERLVTMLIRVQLEKYGKTL